MYKRKKRECERDGFVLGHLARAARKRKENITRSVECSVYEWINNVGYRGGRG